VLWDLDGTLVDTEPFWLAAELEVTTAFGVTWTEADSRATIGQHLPVVGRWLHAKGVPLDPGAVVARLLATVLRHLVENGVPWQPGARDLLAAVAAAGIPAALVTMSYRSVADVVLAQAPAGALRLAVTGDEVREGKPHPEAYLTAAARLGVDVHRCVAIEDSPTGVAAAEAAGARVVAVPHLVEVPAAPGRSRVRSLADVDVASLACIAAGDVRDDLR
jgi:HAD superfamily hydrolase (TIGR01509 family)